ncbi:MAG: DoxX family protein [Muribaculaceae bacterium]|nr:DoxX family protein [Muribaculaceae bacterium]
MNDKKAGIPFWRKAVTWLVRLLTGSLFIFSGFAKAIDPWGTILKVGEYVSVLGLQIWPSIILIFVFGLCAVEFVVGCFLLTGCYRKSCPIVAMIIMCFMLPLSAWIMITEPVADCGCFGDAFVVSNQVTFVKNIFICCGLIWLLLNNTKVICLITPAFQWLSVVSSGVFIVFIELCGYFYQPLIDFRNYPEGAAIFDTEEDGEISGGLYVFDIDTDEEVTELLASKKGPELWIMIPDVAKVSPATTWKLNSLYEWSQDNKVGMAAVVSGSKEEIDNWEDLSMAEYPIYLADDTSIMEVVRGNPGVVFSEDGKIVWKSTLAAINIDDFLSSEVGKSASDFGIDKERLLMNVIFIYLIIEAFLILISFTPRLARLLTRGGLASSKGIRLH